MVLADDAGAFGITIAIFRFGVAVCAKKPASFEKDLSFATVFGVEKIAGLDSVMRISRGIVLPDARKRIPIGITHGAVSKRLIDIVGDGAVEFDRLSQGVLIRGSIER